MMNRGDHCLQMDVWLCKNPGENELQWADATDSLDLRPQLTLLQWIDGLYHTSYLMQHDVCFYVAPV